MSSYLSLSVVQHTADQQDDDDAQIHLHSSATSLSRLLLDGVVAVTQTAFPRCTATLRRCIRNENKRGSAVELAMRRPSSWRKSNADSATAPSPLQWVWSRTMESGDRLLYFDFFWISSASFATALGPTTALLRWLKTSVSGQVKSHTRARPRVHGTIERPSSLLPSLRLSDAGSNMAGVSADASARLMRSLTALCLKWRPADLRQDRPWVPAALTCSPHTRRTECLNLDTAHLRSSVTCCRGECQQLNWDKRWGSRQHDVMTPQ